MGSSLVEYQRETAKVGRELGQSMGLNDYGSGILAGCFSHRVICEYLPELQVRLVTACPILTVSLTETIISSMKKVFLQNSLGLSDQKISEVDAEDTTDIQNDDDLTEEERKEEKRRIDEYIKRMFTKIVGVSRTQTAEYYATLTHAGDALDSTLFRTPLNNTQVRALINYYSRSLQSLMAKASTED